MSNELTPTDTESTGVIERVSDSVEPVEPQTPVPAPPVIEVITPAAVEVLTCPECGTVASVTVNRRDAADFCRTCDYPLFWTPSRVHYDSVSRSADETLRRLPGTVGRATIASLPCPHCAEPNALSAQVCIRCGLSMHPIEAAPPPPPEPEYEPPPPAVYIEPEHGIAWWVWALLATGLVALAVLLILVLTHTIN
jgi:hypothetical protein